MFRLFCVSRSCYVITAVRLCWLFYVPLFSLRYYGCTRLFYIFCCCYVITAVLDYFTFSVLVTLLRLYGCTNYFTFPCSCYGIKLLRLYSTILHFLFLSRYYVITAVLDYFTFYTFRCSCYVITAVLGYIHVSLLLCCCFVYFHIFLTHFLVLRVTLLRWLYLLISQVSFLLHYYGFSCFLIKGKGCTPLYIHFLIHSTLLRYYNCTRLCTIYLDLVMLPRLFIGLSISEVG